jgi:hypothetical protein
LADVMPCVVAQDGDTWTIDESHRAYPRVRMGLGDMVAAGLEAIGITKARVAAAMGVTDCGCNKRQQQLNALGRWLGIGATKLGGES